MSGSASCTAACIAGRNISYHRRLLRYDGSIPGPLPLICPSQRILNSCSALIKYRRVQTSLHRIIIRFESWLLSIILATLPLPFSSLLCTLLSQILEIHLCHNCTIAIEGTRSVHTLSVPRYRSMWQDHVGTSVLRCRLLASYVPLCSDLSESVSCTATCIAGR